MEEARALFRNADVTQFVIVTIPTAMAAAESARLAKALLQEQVWLSCLPPFPVAVAIEVPLSHAVCASWCKDYICCRL